MRYVLDIFRKFDLVARLSPKIRLYKIISPYLRFFKIHGFFGNINLDAFVWRPSSSGLRVMC